MSRFSWLLISAGLSVLAISSARAQVEGSPLQGPGGVRLDPTSLLGRTMAAPLDRNGPDLAWVHPNHGPPGTIVKVHTASSSTAEGSAWIRLGDAPAVQAFPGPTGEWMLPSQDLAGGGPVAVMIQGAATRGGDEDLSTWFVPTTTPLRPIAGGVTPLVGERTVHGELSGDGDQFTFIVGGEAGDRVHAAAFGVDPLTRRLVDPSSHLDAPSLTIAIRDAASGQIQAIDRNSGPGDNPALRWELPYDGKFLIELKTRPDSGGGFFLANLACRGQGHSSAPPKVLGVSPQLVRPGDMVRIEGLRFRSEAEASLHGTPIPTRRLSENTLLARIPWGAPSGPLQVTTDHGASPYLLEDPRVQVAVLPGPPQTSDRLQIGDVARGRLNGGEERVWEIMLAPGQEFVLEAWALDDLGRHLAAATGPTPLDLVVRVEGPGFDGVLARDDDSGPGLDPRLGSMISQQGFRALRGGWHRIALTERGQRGGPFALAVQDPHRPGGRVTELEYPLALTVFEAAGSKTSPALRVALERQLAELDQWKQAGIHPRIVALRRVAVPAADLDIATSLELSELIRQHATPGLQDVFLVRSLPPSRGQATVALTWIPDGTICLAASELPGARDPRLGLTLAHELGHALGRLADLGMDQTDNLMHGTLSSQAGGALSPAQVNRARYGTARHGPAAGLTPTARLAWPSPRDHTPPR